MGATHCLGRLKVCERVGKSVSSVCKKTGTVLQVHFMALEKSKKTFWFYDAFLF